MAPLFSLLDYEMERPRRLIDEITNDGLLSIVTVPRIDRESCRPWRPLTVAARDLVSCIKSDKDKFQVNPYVQHFNPEGISVKPADGYIVVEGKPEDKRHFIPRQFTHQE